MYVQGTSLVKSRADAGARHARRFSGNESPVRSARPGDFRHDSYLPMTASPLSTARVSALNFYPVKSCRGTALFEAVIGARGIVGDRSFMLVNGDGRFLSQRESARMALIDPRLTEEVLSLAAPGQETLSIPVRARGERREVTVWRDRCDAVDQGDAAAEWASDFLGVSCRLVRIADDAVRAVDRDFAVSDGDQVAFADGYPFLLTTEESLADLNGRMSEALPMNRFRPNVVLSGVEPFAEDGWRRIRIGEIIFAVVKPCARCAITTTDQATAERGKEPLQTLATYRQVPGKGVMFGQNLIHQSTGVIRVGSPVELIE